MGYSASLIATLMVAALAAAPVEAQSPAAGSAPTLQASVGFGTIRGTVSDTRGGALGGALVSALGAASAVAVTDVTGRFSFGNLPPGPYLLRAHLPGFIASERELVQVRPNFQLVRAISLRRLGAVDLNDGTPPELLAAGGIGRVGSGQDPAGAEADPGGTGDHSHTATAWRLRHIKRSVLRDANGLPAGEATDTPDANHAWPPTGWFDWAVDSSARIASALFDSSLTGEVNFLTTGSFNSPQELFTTSRIPRGVAYLSLGAPVGPGNWVVRAALTGGDVSSWVLAGSYTGRALESHRLDLGLSYGAQQAEPATARTAAALANPDRSVGAISGYDSWMISPRVELDYGARYGWYDYTDRENMFSPQIGVSVSPLSHTYIRASVSQQMVAPGAEEFLPPSAPGLWLPPERTFAPLVGDSLRAERVRHFEVELERQFDDTYVVGVRRFYQQSDDQIVTLFGTDDAVAAQGHYLVASGGAVDAEGWGVRLSSTLARHLRGSVDYSLTHARWFPSAETPLVATLAPSAARTDAEAFHDVTTSLEAAIPETATRVYFAYKLNTGYARADRAETPGLDGRFDVRVHQALPFMPLIGGEWEVLLTVRNLFREPMTGGSVYDELLVVRPPKRVVGGFLVRF